MINFTLFLTYETTEYFERVLWHLQKSVQDFPDTVEILIFYHQALDIHTLKNKFPSTRWWRINKKFAHTNLLIAKAMHISRGKVFFYLDGVALFALSDFTNMANMLQWHKGVAFATPKFYIPLKTDDREENGIVSFFRKMACKEKNAIYQYLNSEGCSENFRLCGFDKEALASFFSSLSKAQRLTLLKEKFRTGSSLLPPVGFFMLLKKKQIKNFVAPIEESASRFFCTTKFYFSFYNKFFSLFRLVFKHKYMPPFVSASWFSVPVVQLAFVLLLVFFFSVTMRWISLVIIIFFSFFFAIEKTKKFSLKKIVKEIIFVPFRLVKKIFFILWL